MDKFSVNISVNKTFTECAEELLTSCSQSIHDLSTDLLTACAIAQGKLKNPVKRQECRTQCDTLIRCLITGWVAAVKGAATPPRSTEPRTGPPRLDNLQDPYCSRGFQICCKQVDGMLSKGHHISQQRALREVVAEQADSTKLNCHPDAPN